MATYLTQEWLDQERTLLAAAPPRAGSTYRVQRIVTGGPGGEVRAVTVIEDGIPVASTLGGDDTADVSLTLTHADSVRVLDGDLDLNAAFMSGRMKVAGATRPLLDLLGLAQQPAWTDARAELAAATSR